MEGVTLMNLIRLEDRDRLKRLMRDSMKQGKIPRPWNSPPWIAQVVSFRFG